jgi:hypothetical protein
VPPENMCKSVCFDEFGRARVSAVEDEDLELEQIVERLPRVVNPRSRRFAFNGRARGVERAGVDGVLRRHTRGHGLHALEAAARVERSALRASVQFSPAPRTAAVESHFFFDHCAALCASDHLAETRHVDVARAVLRNAARAGGRARFRRRTRRLRLRLPVAIVVVVTALTVFAVAHMRGAGTLAGILVDG